MEKKWHSSLSVPRLPASNMSAVAKKVIMMEKLFLFRKPFPSLLKTTQVQHLKPGSAKEAYLSSTQHAGDFLCPTYNTLVCTALHNVCSLCNAATSWSARVPNSPLWSCCLSNPHPLSTYTPDCSYQSLIFCILSWLNCIQGYWALLPVCQILQSQSLSRDLFPNATWNLPKKLVKAGESYETA